MRKSGFLLCLLGVSFCAEPNFEGIQKKSATAQEVGVSDRNAQAASSVKGKTLIFSQSDFEVKFPLASLPKSQDIELEFDDQVVNSFADHLLYDKIPGLEGMRYSLVDKTFEVAVVLDLENLQGFDEIRGKVSLDRKNASSHGKDQMLLAVRGVFEVFTVSGELNSACLSFDRIQTYLFYKDGKSSKANGDQKNLKTFWKYLQSSSTSGKTLDQKKAELKVKRDEFRKNGDLQGAMKIQDELDSLLETQDIQDEGEKFDSGIYLTPELVGQLVFWLKSNGAFNRYLDLIHYGFEKENAQSNDVAVRQILKVSRIDKAIQVALPELDLSWVRVEDSKMIFTGKIREGFDF